MIVYLSTVRLIIDYAAPVLVCKGRIRKLEIMQNEAMKVILGCPRNKRVDIMRADVGLEYRTTDQGNRLGCNPSVHEK